MFTYHLQNKEFYLHNNCISVFNDTTPAPRVNKKTQFTLLKKIKSFVVFKMKEVQLVVISSNEEDEVIITKKPKLEESIVVKRDAFFTIKSVPGDGNCIVNCFSTFLRKLHQKS